MRSKRIAVFSCTFIAFLAVCAIVLGQEKDAGRRYRITGEVVSQSYCELSKGSEFSLGGRVRLRLTNESKENLIVSRHFLSGPYAIKVARDSAEMAAGHYEYKPIIDWTVEVIGPDGKPAEPLLPEAPIEESPGADFEILKPSEYIEGNVDLNIFPISEQPTRSKLGAGSHVFRYTIGGWNTYTDREEKYRTRWRKFGWLIYEAIQTEPIPLSIPDLPVDMKSCGWGQRLTER